MLRIDPMSTSSIASTYSHSAPSEVYSPSAHHSSIARSEASESALSQVERPKLTPPSMIRLLGATEETRSLGKTLLGVLTDRLSYIKENIDEISSENIAKLKESAAKANSSVFWSVLKKIATSLLSAFSVIFGISLLASGGAGFIGGAMIASGILSLANFGLAEMGAWDWVAQQLAQDNEERRQKLAMLLPIASGILCAGIGLVGSAWSIGSNAVNFAEKAVSIAQTTLSLFDGVTTLGKGAADANLLWTQADLTLIQGKLTTERSMYDLLIEGIKGSLVDFRSMASKTNRAMQTFTESVTAIIRN
jgi:hypothetical protein